MKIKNVLLAAAAAVGMLLTGCQSDYPANTSAGMNGLQQKALSVRNIGEEFGATYDDVWYAAISTLQMDGFILKDADKTSGFIYGVWQDSYESHKETTKGAFSMATFASSMGFSFGGFSSSTNVYKQIEVSVTLEPLAKTQTLVRLVSRFDTEGIPMAEGVFANRFFGMLRREVFLRKNRGSIYQDFSATNNK